MKSQRFYDLKSCVLLHRKTDEFDLWNIGSVLWRLSDVELEMFADPVLRHGRYATP
ncbi:hypothetical protein [Arthrobacter sp. AG1021]|uniref:hypothetical protein n=1 Tax=Arthrobacter sp. AG1021 TaxID=2183908 RepID=UPI0015FFDEC9|nr:hypothetical protein [Arthrobacter sp. AG1021]